ncbi:hypothetical protein GIB67_021523 [Kingdonia uniflora]|uniref:Uncharacterized protein n=1 Tax=Kingdonia uniflora TaxID=39325 RepID=A0A7J7L9N3_9MAGN|nr:hypothetical protein GIB67_021523 [Kingdonia uniflora]
MSMVSTSGCTNVDEVDLVGYLSPVIGVGDEVDTVAELVEWPRLKGSRVEHPTGGDYLYLLPNLAKEKKCKRLRDEVFLEYVQGAVKDSRSDAFCCYLAQFDYGLTLPLSNLAKSVTNMIGACPAQLNCNFWEVILVCETLNERWATSDSEMRITAKDFQEYYAVKYVTATDGAYLSSSSSRPCFFDPSSAGRVWNDNLLWLSGECLQRSDEEPLKLNNKTITKGINCKVSRKESFIDVVAREGIELEDVLKVLEISRFKRVASKDDKVRRSQAKRRLVGKTLGSMEEKLLTPVLNTPLKLAQLNEMLDGPVDMATVSNTVVRTLAKRKAVKRGAASRSVTSDSVDDSSKRRKVTSHPKSQVVLEENDKIAQGADLRPRFEVETGLLEEQCRAIAREKTVVVVDDEFKKFSRALRGVQLGFQDRSIELLELEKEKEAATLKLKEVRAESIPEAKRLVTPSPTSQNNLAGKLYQLREREEQTLLFNAEYAEEYKALISQYEDRLDDNVKLSLKLEEAKSQVEDMTVTILSRDLALNQLTSKLAELKEKAASSSRYEAELAEYWIRALNDEISDMKYKIRALNEQLLKKEIDQDTARNDLAVSVADFEKMNSSIVGKDLELRNSAQIRDSLIARLDRLKADLRCLKGRKAQSRADLAEIQANNKSLVDDLAYTRRNSIDLTRHMSEHIDQSIAELAESKARRLKDNKRAAVTHQAFKELVVHEQEKCDGEALHQ